MKKLQKEKKRFNREYIKPITGGLVLFVLIVVLLIVFGYNPGKDNKDNREDSNNVSMDVKDKTLTNSISCDTEYVKTIKNEVSKVSVSIKQTIFEGEPAVDWENSIDEEVYYTPKYRGYVITLSNITDNFKAIVTNDYNEDAFTLTKSESSFNTKYIGLLNTYTVKILTNNQNCENEIVREFNFTTPAFNRFSEMLVCQDNDNKNCDELIYSPIDIESAAKDYEIKQKQKEEQKESEKKGPSIVLIVGLSIAAVLIVVIVIYIINVKRRKRMVI